MILYNNETSGGINAPNFKVYYSAIVINPALYWHKNTQMDQWNWMEDADINPPTYGHWFLTKKQNYTVEKRKHIPEMVLA